MKRIGILTSGGDAPGLNAAIKGVVWIAAENGVEILGLRDGWAGLLDARGEAMPLDPNTVRTWDRDGGTHIGSSRTNPFACRTEDGPVDRSGEFVANARDLGLGALVALGGEDTMGVAHRISELGMSVVGIPKTIDKDLYGTDYTIGFDTALRNCVEIIDRARVPAGSHHWVQVIEVMGRHAGHLAFWSGVAGGAYIILVPEHPFAFERLRERLEQRLSRKGREYPRYAVLVVAEGAYAKGGDLVTVNKACDDFGHVQLGGVGTSISSWIRRDTPWDSRSVALGHPQRGGVPTAVDRSVGLTLGSAAVKLLLQGRSAEMVSVRGGVHDPKIGSIPLKEVAGRIQYLDTRRYYDEKDYNIRPQVARG